MNGQNQTNVLEILTNMINNNKVSHALLFEVDDSDTSMEFIKEIIKLILCQNVDKSIDKMNCSKCNICKLIDSDTYPDIKIISSDGNWIKKQQLIDLQTEFNNKSLFNNKRIYIIKEAERLNTSSSNSLLKFLEEPCDDVIAILLTKNRYLLLDTIISRCQIFSLKKEEFVLNAETLEKVENFIEYISMKRNLFIYYKDIYENILTDKDTCKKVLSELEKYFISYLEKDKTVNNSNTYDLLNKLTINEMVLYVKIIESELQKLEYNLNYKIWMDSFFSRIMGEVYD